MYIQGSDNYIRLDKLTKYLSRIMVCCVALMLCGTACAEEAMNARHMAKLFDGVYDAGIYTQIDYTYAQAHDAEMHDDWLGFCTAAAKVLPCGDTVVGRNLDMPISDVPIYVFRTQVPGCYETITLSYDSGSGYSEEQLLADGMPEAYAKVLPFYSPDILNSAGLFIEMNMRTSEPDETGVDKFGTSGTNPGAAVRVSELALTRYIAEHCATIEEVLDYIQTLDVYTMNKGGYAWGLCYLMADATGRYGVLEIADNQIVWLENEAVQTNFYLHPAFAEKQEMKIGVGRYELARFGLSDVSTEQDMLNLVKQVSYFQSYTPAACAYDVRSECVGKQPHWTYDYVMNEANQAEIDAYLDEREHMAAKQQGDLWMSVLSEVVNCSQKRITVRLWEDEEKILVLEFGK